MDPASLALAALIWHGSTEIALGRAQLGPWQMNESRWDYVDDPTVAIDERGGIAVAWVDQGRKDVFFQRFSPEGAKSGDPVNVSRSPKVFSWLPRIAIDAKGRIFVLWQEIIFSGGSHGGDILFARSEDGGATFSKPLNLSNSVAGDGKGRINKDMWHNGSLDLAVAGDGTIYAAWTEYEGALWVRRSTDGGKTFSRLVRIGDPKPARAPALAVDSKEIYLAWTVGDDRSADIHIAKSTDGGASFSKPQIVERTPGYSDAPKLALDASGTLHLVYAEADRGPFGRKHVRYTRSGDAARSFETPRDISGPDAGFPALGIDGKGNLYVLWERFQGQTVRPRGLGIAVSRDAGRTFKTAEVPEGAGAGWNGSLQGLLMRKLAVNREGAIAIVNSSFADRERSRVWLVRGRLAAN
jgi:hypothetical protein